MIDVCYIAQENGRVTSDPEKAMSVKLVQGERRLIFAEEGLLTTPPEDRAPLTPKAPFSSDLCNGIFQDIASGESYGFYFLNGTKLEQEAGGYCIGGAGPKEPLASEILVDPSHIIDPKDVIAIASLLIDEMHDEASGISYWMDREWLCFDRFTWVESLEDAKDIAFGIRCEHAIWDVANNAEMFDMSKLQISNDPGYSYGQFLKHAYRYRNAQGTEKMDIRQHRYLDAVFQFDATIGPLAFNDENV